MVDSQNPNPQPFVQGLDNHKISIVRIHFGDIKGSSSNNKPNISSFILKNPWTFATATRPVTLITLAVNVAPPNTVPLRPATDRLSREISGALSSILIL